MNGKSQPHVPRAGLVNLLRDYLISGMDVELVGRVGSGRSVIMRMLAERMEAAGWGVLILQPLPAGPQIPYGAFNAAVRNLRADEPLNFRGEDQEYLEKFLATRSMVVFFDDWRDIDVASWQMIAGLRRNYEVRVVSSHEPGPVPVFDPRGLPATPGTSPVSVKVPPLSLSELRTLLESDLGANIENSTLSHIYAKSAGLPGLALAITRACRVDGSIAQDKGSWRATRELWSFALKGIARRQMVGLSQAQMDAVAVLANADFIDVESAMNILDPEILEQLEFREFIHADRFGFKKWISVNPPILADYFRNDGFSIRGTRIERELSANDVAAYNADDGAHAITAARPTPQFYRLAMDRLDSELAASTRAWNKCPSPRTALAHLEALNESGSSKIRIEKILRIAVKLTGPAEDVARLRVWHARWRANENNDLVEALEILNNREGLGPYARLLDAAKSHLDMYFASTSEDILLDLDDDVELPMAVRQELARQRAKVYVTLARFDEAWETLENITSWDEDPHPHLLPALKALIHLGRGEFNEAIRIVVSDFLKARGEVSMRSIKSSGNVLALLLLVRGQHAPLESLSETVLDPGREPHFPLTPTLGVVCCVACNSNNDASVVQDYLAQAKSIQVPDGPFPGMTRSWPEARLKALRGSQHEAAGIMWDSALRSMELGRVFAACTDAVASLELHYDSARMNLLDGWLESVRSPFIEGMVSYLKAVHREDAQCILDAAPRLAAGGRVAHALKAYEIAGELFAEQGRMDKASEANELLRDYESILEPGAIDAHRTSKPQSSPLTSRERDVVELVAEGLTNQVIARKLVLSVRTVENHIHRAMRKTGTTTRQELGRSVIAM